MISKKKKGNTSFWLISYFSMKKGGRRHNDTMTLNIIIRLAVKSLSV